jgi:hypothetical protein
MASMALLKAGQRATGAYLPDQESFAGHVE